MNLKYIFLLTAAALFILICCKDEISSPAAGGTVYQKGKCNGPGLAKSNADSCFNYSFSQKLLLEFCVIGNCCPDSNRFIANYEIAHDTVKIFVQNAAPNLCRCVCKYLLHAEFSNLTFSSIVVNCFEIAEGKPQLLYNRRINRI